jgi:hypothetical protein
MVKTKRTVYDVKSGKQWEEEYEYTPPPTVEIPKPVSLEKLVQVLINKGVIKDRAEVEA